MQKIVEEKLQRKTNWEGGNCQEKYLDEILFWDQIQFDSTKQTNSNFKQSDLNLSKILL